MPRANPPQTLRKAALGNAAGDRAVQPGVHTTPTHAGVRIAAIAESPCIPGDPGTFTESFPAADGQPWGNDQVWVQQRPGDANFAAIQVVGNQATFIPQDACVSGTPGLAYGTPAYAAILQRLTPDQVVQLTLSTFDNGSGTATNRVDAMARVGAGPSGGLNDYQATVLGWDGATAYLYIQKNVDGFGATLASAPAHALVVGDVISIEVVGTSLTYKLNGSTILTATDSDLDGACGSSAGFGLNGTCVPGTGTDDLRVDAWSVVAT